MGRLKSYYWDQIASDNDADSFEQEILAASYAFEYPDEEYPELSGEDNDQEYDNR